MKPKGLFILDSESFDLIYGPDERRALAEFVDIPAAALSPAEVRSRPELLRDVELVFSGWDGPVLDEAFLQAAPRLRAFFYGAGSIKSTVTDAFWKRDIPIASSWGANAIPVAEFTVAQIVLSLKRFWQAVHAMKTHGGRSSEGGRIPGAYGSTVGIVSMGMIGRLVRERLRSFELHVLAYDPFLDAARAAELEVESCPLDELFRRSDVVTLHSPWLPATEGMIGRPLLEAMKPHATLINTARGAIVNEPELAEVLGRRPDLLALLDVTHPEPPAPGSPLWTLPNVVLTPHIAGSQGLECRRMGRWMVDEARRFLSGEPLRWRVTEAQSRVAA